MEHVQSMDDLAELTGIRYLLYTQYHPIQLSILCSKHPSFFSSHDSNWDQFLNGAVYKWLSIITLHIEGIFVTMRILNGSRFECI